MELPIIRILSGFLLLFFGRRIFWLFVGILGFFAGFTFGTRMFAEQSGWVLLLIALGCGLVGILFAIFLQRLAIAIAGFLAGGLLVITFLESIGWIVTPLIPFVIGGILGAILLSVAFDWALIILSSLTGASLLARSAPIERPFGMLLFLVLSIVGIYVQSRFLAPARDGREPLP